eukprot:2016911-Karenia_brevis.AAC.1
MSVVVQHLKQSHQALLKNGMCENCKICKTPMCGPTLHVMDGGQASETIYPESVKSDLSFLLRLATKSGNGLVQVFKAARAIAGTAKSLYWHSSDRVVIASKTISTAVSSYLQFTVYRVGTWFIRQNTGVPIGGFLS